MRLVNSNARCPPSVIGSRTCQARSFLQKSKAFFFFGPNWNRDSNDPWKAWTDSIGYIGWTTIILIIIRGRYHLYVSYSCPWAHRALLVRALKGLEDVISYDSVHWHLGEGGWHFERDFKDSLFGSNFIKEIYMKADPEYNARLTVPVLWDKKANTIGKLPKYFTLRRIIIGDAQLA